LAYVALFLGLRVHELVAERYGEGGFGGWRESLAALRTGGDPACLHGHHFWLVFFFIGMSSLLARPFYDTFSL
jgi:hypothetical protein